MPSDNQGQAQGIFAAAPEPAVRLAAEELQTCLAKMSGVTFPLVDCYAKAGFVLGRYDALAPWLASGKSLSRWDDALFIQSADGRLFFSGPNSRSVLFSVYTYLERLGCRWLYPGPEGASIPAGVTIVTTGWSVYEEPAYRFRGLAAYPLAFEEGRNLVEWMARRRLNYYFQEGFPDDRPGQQARQMPPDETQRRQNADRVRVLAEARRRGLLIERYGHGWEAGILERYAADQAISLEQARTILMSKGASGTESDGQKFAGREFCLSHPDARRLLADNICAYLERHKDEQDVAAIWVGDGWDMACQCAACRKRPFSAWYLELIRDVAQRMKAAAPDLMIECLCYEDTLEPPDGAILEGLDNVMLMLAPMLRCYRHALADDSCRHPHWKPDYRHNRATDMAKLLHPLNGDILDAWRGWRRTCAAPAYVFDYFTWGGLRWDRHFLAYLPETLAADIRSLKTLGLEGVLPCQYCRVAFPTNLILETMARMLWNPALDSRRIRRDYLQDLFGPWAPAAERHLDALRAVFQRLDPHKDPVWQEDAQAIAAVAEGLEARARAFDAEFPPASSAAPYGRRIQYLSIDLQLQLEIFKFVRAHHEGRDAQAPEHIRAAVRLLQTHAAELSRVLAVEDYIAFLSHPGRLIDKINPPPSWW